MSPRKHSQNTGRRREDLLPGDAVQFFRNRRLVYGVAIQSTNDDSEKVFLAYAWRRGSISSERAGRPVIWQHLLSIVCMDRSLIQPLFRDSQNGRLCAGAYVHERRGLYEAAVQRAGTALSEKLCSVLANLDNLFRMPPSDLETLKARLRLSEPNGPFSNWNALLDFLLTKKQWSPQDLLAALQPLCDGTDLRSEPGREYTQVTVPAISHECRDPELINKWHQDVEGKECDERRERTCHHTLHSDGDGACITRSRLYDQELSWLHHYLPPLSIRLGLAEAESIPEALVEEVRESLANRLVLADKHLADVLKRIEAGASPEEFTLGDRRRILEFDHMMEADFRIHLLRHSIRRKDRDAGTALRAYRDGKTVARIVAEINRHLLPDQRKVTRDAVGDLLAHAAVVLRSPPRRFYPWYGEQRVRADLADMWMMSEDPIQVESAKAFRMQADGIPELDIAARLHIELRTVQRRIRIFRAEAKLCRDLPQMGVIHSSQGTLQTTQSNR